jgi:DNA-binding HxlR family transcriptional regulator
VQAVRGRSYEQYCALSQALDRVGERWTLLIVRELVPGPARFRELKAALPGLATNLLTQRLRGMEADGLLTQRLLPPPARVNVYELTEQGHALEPMLNALGLWGTRFLLTARYREPGGPRGFLLALRLVLPQQARSHQPARITLKLGKDAIGITVNKRGAVAITLEPPPQPELTLSLSYRRAFALLLGQLDLRQGIDKKLIKAAGSATVLAVLDDLFAQKKVLREAVDT